MRTRFPMRSPTKANIDEGTLGCRMDVPESLLITFRPAQKGLRTVESAIS
jgi:hypothetical protein